MSKPRIPLADALLQLMVKERYTRIDIGSFGLLEDAYELAYGPGNNGARTRMAHPLNRHAAVMAAVRRSPKFTCTGRIQHCYPSGSRESWHPLYKITGAE